MVKEIHDYINLEDRFNALQCQSPISFCFLPENIDCAENIDEFIFTDSTLTLQKLFKKNDLPLEKIGHDNAGHRVRRSIDWYAPTIFIGYTLLSQNTALTSIGLNVISNYVTDYFKGTFGEKKVRLDVVVETSPKKTYKRITYEGSEKGLKDIDNVIKSLIK